ncbi:MAG TPA: PVC-type heme-binding CxxCH protein [Verrucomicrobiae bacterium]|nr:PVC-type heme-binding CxxCH protein [Verrucomicrobiae bacterium]
MPLRLCLLAVFFVAALRAAEPDVSPSDLPRVPATEPSRALSTFKIRPGLRLELAAAEPLVVDPIAICFDEDSRLFVVEMRDYSERRDERLGRIRLLEDTDGDGKFDKSTIFAEDLPWPTALIWSNGGLLVGSTPDILYFKDTDGDGKADVRKVVFTGFGSQAARLNVQQLFNSLTWTLDHRIHGATGGNGGVIRCLEHPEYPPLDLRNSDFSFNPRTLEMRRENGGGQYGLSFDNAGRKFVCSNSAHIRDVMYDYNWVLPEMQYALPSPSLDIPVDGPAAEVYRISPDEPWRVIRTRWRVAGLVSGPIEGGGRASGYFTGASGITIYRGTALGPEFLGDAFIADIGSNLVHRKKLHSNGVPFKAERAADEEKSEFLASTDNWFRPVTFANSPDGALYVIDMYREVVEHPWSLPANIKKYLDLNSGNDRGRIYRVVGPDFKQPALPKFSRASTSELVALLDHPNGWHRDTASRLLYEKQDRGAIEPIRKLLRSAKSPNGQIHALGALSGLNALQDDDLAVAAASTDADVREVALRFALGHKPINAKLEGALRAAVKDPIPRVRYQLAWTLASVPIEGKAGLLRELAANANDPWERHGIMAAISMEPALAAEFPMAFSSNAKRRPSKGSAPAFVPNATASRAEVVKQLAPALQLTGNAAKGKTIFLERCSSCHRLFGQGTPVGPDLESVRSSGKETIFNNILDPNREISKGFDTYEISTKGGGEPLVGILANDSPNGLTIRQANGIETFIQRNRVEKMHSIGKSLMPEGLEAALTPQDLANLLAFITGQP